MVRILMSVLGLASLVGLTACERQRACVMPDEPARILDLTRESDRQHLEVQAIDHHGHEHAQNHDLARRGQAVDLRRHGCVESVHAIAGRPP